MAAPTSKILANGIHPLIAFLDMFPVLSAHHKVLILDPSGLGASVAPPNDDYIGNNIAATGIAAIRPELGADLPYHLVGHDVGSWISFSIAFQDQAHIRTLSLLAAAISSTSTSLPFPLPDEANVKLWQYNFNRLPGGQPEELVRSKGRVLLSWLFQYGGVPMKSVPITHQAVHPERITAEQRDEYVRGYAGGGAIGRGFAYYRSAAVSAAQNQQALEKGKMQITVLCAGGRGGTVKGIPNMITTEEGGSGFVVLVDCGHYVMQEQPEACARTVLDFIGSV